MSCILFLFIVIQQLSHENPNWDLRELMICNNAIRNGCEILAGLLFYSATDLQNRTSA
ncbi:hypothetical protein M758_4G025500 [Ceratodon purpureus]|uniref:Uncharacterized protein n=1 Tax=Ceratodon purpureus TaxID=3225 RepID=A0A8T0I4L1_CERPU|nr:hypothetical protein KC19_4G028400 [Ceratodon purpureus]KAG0617933.1 hypothetical protein M758_4G025500 [Ceratodon purpureus]